MNHLTILLTISTAFWLSASLAQDTEILIPSGWTATEEGIVKGDNELFVGPVLDLGDLSATEYLTKLAKVPFEGSEITHIDEPESSDTLVQIKREVIVDGNKARSTLFICKDGKNKHRLLELLTVDAFSLISGGRAAVDFCHQS